MGCCCSCLVDPSSSGFHKSYSVLRHELLGQGSCSLVYKAKHKKTGDIIAVKLIPKKYALSKHIWEEEISILKQCAGHPNIITLRDVCESENDVEIFMDLAMGGELFKKLIRDGAYSEMDTRKYVKDLLNALNYLHAQGIVHRDLKPENLLINSTDPSDIRLQISDFSMASILKPDKLMENIAGTWAYAAPEVLKINQLLNATDYVEETSFPYNEKCDLWSVGIIVFILLTGTHPFDPNGQQTSKQMKEKIMTCDYNFNESKIWNDISKEAKEFIQHLLILDPKKRYNASEALSSSWLNEETILKQTPLSPKIHEILCQYHVNIKKKLRASVHVNAAAHSLYQDKNKFSNIKEEDVARAESVDTNGYSMYSRVGESLLMDEENKKEEIKQDEQMDTDTNDIKIEKQE